MSKHDIVRGIRSAGRSKRRASVSKYRMWQDVQHDALREAYSNHAFLAWLDTLDFDEEKQDYIDVGFEDESFIQFMWNTWEAEGESD